jgi:hypothetical protein
MNRNLKRIGAVLAGLVTVVALSTLTDVVLHAAGVYPPWGQPMADGLFLFALAYRAAFGIAGSLLAARLAPDHPMAHALTLGIIGAVVGLAGTAATWDRGPAFGPHWYPVALIALSIPNAWLGGRLAELTRPASAIARSSEA